jgi:hypothetical protein
MGIEERKEFQAKEICNIFNNIITESLPNLECFAIQVQKATRTPNKLDKNRPSPWHIIIKTTNTENAERILMAVKREKQITYKGKPIKITVDFSMETLKARRAWSEVFWPLNENKFNPSTLPSKTIIQNRWSNKNLPQ